MSMRWLALAAVAAGCDGSDAATAPPLGGSLRVEGAVHDFKSGARIDGTADVSTSGLAPEPTPVVDGTRFILEGVPENSVFHVLAAVAPTHRATFGPAVEVTSDDQSGIVIPAVSEAFLGELATAFNVTPTAGRGVLLVQIVTSTGQPRGGVSAATLSIDGGAGIKGPYFLDSAITPAPGATMTSPSAWVVYFDVAPGIAGLKAAATATLTLDVPLSPVDPDAVTVVRAVATDGMVTTPTNVSFANQVFPIFRTRGCVACHESGNGPGRDLGNLTLNQNADLVYRELLMEEPGRVVVGAPETSLVLTKPLREEPTDGHPNSTFANTLDADYQVIRAWIAEGAKQN